jgi:uncharacterized protein YjiS (DUF1127 family)
LYRGQCLDCTWKITGALILHRATRDKAMSQSTLTATALPRPAAPPRPVMAVLRRWWRHALTRRDLSEVPDHILRDIGVSPAEARHEARLPFWRE